MDSRKLRGLPERPRLASHVTVQTSATETSLIRTLAGGVRTEFSLGSDAGPFATRVLPLLDGTRAMPALLQSLESEFDADDIVSALHEIADNGLLEEGGVVSGVVDGLRCYRSLLAGESRWAATSQHAAGFSSPAGLSRTDFVRYWRGWWSENLHFAANAAKKFALIAARYPEHRSILQSFLVEEHDHILIFRKGARALGMDPDAIMSGAPLPETAALNAYILQTAKRAPLLLAWVADRVERATESIMRAPDGTMGTFRAFAMDRLSDFPEFLASYFDHADIEQAAAHGSYGRDMFDQTESISAAQFHELCAMAERLEVLFARKNAAVTELYLRGGSETPRKVTNALAALHPDAAPVVLDRDVQTVTADVASALRARPSWSRLEDPRRREALAAVWAYVQREWAMAAMVSPSLATDFDSRYALTCVAVSLAQRTEGLEVPAGWVPSAPQEGLAAVIAEEAEISCVGALAQAALLDAIGQELGSALGGELGAPGFLPVRATLPNRQATALEALGALGPCGAREAKAVGVHLQVVSELVGSLIDSLE